MGSVDKIRPARCSAVARAGVCACLLAVGLLAPGAVQAATVLYDFTSPPDTVNLLAGSFTYHGPGDLSATFEGLQHDDSGAFPDHTNGSVGAVFGAGPGPAIISFSSPVDLVELYVNNFAGDFDSRPEESKLFSVTAFLGNVSVFTYDRAALSAVASGVSENYLLIAPAQPITIDSISLSNFDSDALDDLKVNVVPEPAGAAVTLAGALAVVGGRRRRRRKNQRGGHAPERDPPRRYGGGQYIPDTQARGVACAVSEKKDGWVADAAGGDT